MKEAPSSEGLLLFQRHPHREITGGWVTYGVGWQTVMSIIDTNNYRTLEVRRRRRKKWLVCEMNDFYRYFRPKIRTL